MTTKVITLEIKLIESFDVSRNEKFWVIDYGSKAESFSSREEAFCFLFGFCSANPEHQVIVSSHKI